MCGIAGFVSYSQRFDEQKLSVLTDSLAHRGPDAAGYYFNSEEPVTVGLGHRRLSIIDLSETANQPMYSACGRYVTVYNGEVYNLNPASKSKFLSVSRGEIGVSVHFLSFLC